MANSVMMFDALGIPADNPERAIARKSIDKLLVVKADEAYCQPCVSPVWDTALAAHALLEAGEAGNIASAQRGLDWLAPLQVLEVKGDWGFKRPDVRPGGWAFQYANPHYPDLDDTAVIVVGMARAQKEGGANHDAAMARAREWIEGLQSSDGGWGAFDADNTHEFLNNIPFADHGALLDPPSPDLTARCVSMLAQLGATIKTSPEMRRGVNYLRRTQLPDGSWYGRWGINYVYGTWSALCALNAAGLSADAPEIKRAAEWLISIQNADGGWGEDGDSYKLAYRGHEKSISTPSQTAWALLGLMAAGAADASRRRARRRVSARDAGSGRAVERARLYRHRLPARVLPALPRLSEILPAVGAGALPQFEINQFEPRGLRPMSAPFVVVATGLDFEARLAHAEGATKVCCGRGTQMAVALATAVGPGCRGIISFGIAGGLDPQLRPGAVIVASSVIGANGVKGALPTSEGWSQGLLGACAHPVQAPILGVDAAVTEPSDKMRLFMQTGAAALDMESHIAASVAVSQGLPFAALRVIADSAQQRIPQAALAGMREDGSTDAMGVLRALMQTPGDLFDLPGVAFNAYVAKAALARARRSLGAGFGLPDFA